MQGVELTLLLEDAYLGKPGAARVFYEALLTSSVFVPVKAEKDSFSGIPLVGENATAVSDFLVVQFEGQKVVPVFSRESFVSVWATREVPVREMAFDKLLWLVGNDVGLYVNPCQEYGKEITAWEVERLRQGAEAVPEVVAEIEVREDNVQVTTGSQLYPKLKARLTSIVESYPEIAEVFLVEVKYAEAEDVRPLIGLKLNGGLEEKTEQLLTEFRECFRSSLPEHIEPVIVDDLANSASANRGLFEGATPFYIRQQELPAREREPFKERVKRLFSRS